MPTSISAASPEAITPNTPSLEGPSASNNAAKSKSITGSSATLTIESKGSSDTNYDVSTLRDLEPPASEPSGQTSNTSSNVSDLLPAITLATIEGMEGSLLNEQGPLSEEESLAAIAYTGQNYDLSMTAASDVYQAAIQDKDAAITSFAVGGATDAVGAGVGMIGGGDEDLTGDDAALEGTSGNNAASKVDSGSTNNESDSVDNSLEKSDAELASSVKTENPTGTPPPEGPKPPENQGDASSPSSTASGNPPPGTPPPGSPPPPSSSQQTENEKVASGDPPSSAAPKEDEPAENASASGDKADPNQPEASKPPTTTAKTDSVASAKGHKTTAEEKTKLEAKQQKAQAKIMKWQTISNAIMGLSQSLATLCSTGYTVQASIDTGDSDLDKAEAGNAQTYESLMGQGSQTTLESANTIRQVVQSIDSGVQGEKMG